MAPFSHESTVVMPEGCWDVGCGPERGGCVEHAVHIGTDAAFKGGCQLNAKDSGGPPNCE